MSTNPEPSARQRRPRTWLAVLFALLGTGLGYVYCGRVLRAAVVTVLTEAVGLLAALFFTLGSLSAPAVLLALLFPLAFSIAVCIDVARCARQGRARFLRRGAVLGACLLYLPLGAGFGWAATQLRLGYVAEPFYIPSASMWPGAIVGDHFFVNRLAGRSRAPRAGEVVVFRLAREGKTLHPPDRRPELPTEQMVKRVVGVPGEVIELRGAALYVNGERLASAEPIGSYPVSDREVDVLAETRGEFSYRILDDPKREGRFGPVMVEPDRYFLAGDNRDISHDSRLFGSVHRDAILGPVADIYWSWSYLGESLELLGPSVLLHALREQTHWDRIGRSLHEAR